MSAILNLGKLTKMNHSVLSTLIMGISLALAACDRNDDALAGLPPLTKPEPPAREHPPIIFEQHVFRPGSVPQNRPLLYGDYVLQYFQEDNMGMPASKWSGLVRYHLTTGAADTLLHLGAGSAIPYSHRVDAAGRAYIATSLPNQVHFVDIVSKVVTGPFTRPSLGGACSQEGIYCIDAEDHGPTRGATDVVLFDASQARFRKLFSTPRLPGSMPSTMSRSYSYIDEAGTHLYGEFDYHDRETRTSPSHAFAYNLTTSELEWVNVFPPENDAANAQKIAVDADNVYQKSANRVVAYDRRTGKERWRRDMPDVQIGQSPLMVGGGRVYFLSDMGSSQADRQGLTPYGRGGGTYGLDATTGALVFYNAAIGGTCVAAEEYRGLYVLLATGNGRGHRLHIFDPTTGQYQGEGWESPRCGSGGNCGFFVDNFSVDAQRGWVTAHDWNHLYVFDISAYGHP